MTNDDINNLLTIIDTTTTKFRTDKKRLLITKFNQLYQISQKHKIYPKGDEHWVHNASTIDTPPPNVLNILSLGPNFSAPSSTSKLIPQLKTDLKYIYNDPLFTQHNENIDLPRTSITNILSNHLQHPLQFLLTSPLNFAVNLDT